MLALLDSLNVHHFPTVQPILMILVSKFMVHRALSDKAYLSLGLLSTLSLSKLADLSYQHLYSDKCLNVSLPVSDKICYPPSRFCLDDFDKSNIQDCREAHPSFEF